MTQACGCWHEKKVHNNCAARWQQPSVRVLLVHDVMFFLLSLLLGGHRNWAAALSEPIDAYHTFHLRPFVRGQHHQYSQSQWTDLWKTGSEGSPWASGRGKVFGDGGVGMTLVHRDAAGSPFRTSFSKLQANSAYGGPDFATIIHKSLQRDVVRMRSIESFLTTKEATVVVPSKKLPAVGPPLESPVISGLDFGSGEYFTTLSFGSPPTEVLVTIDNGSDLVWLQCHPCDSCYDQIGPIFNPGASRSYETVPCYSTACITLPDSNCEGLTCLYTANYGDGSFSTGEFATETITLNSTQGSPTELRGLYFGCGHDNEGLFTASAGLLGLGRGHLSFPSQISQVLAPRFSYCLRDRFPTSTVSSSKGNSSADGDGQGGDGDGGVLTATSYLYFGEAESESMQYTDLLRNPVAPSYYYLHLTGISVGSELVAIPASALELDLSSGKGGVILDTGTAVTRLCSVAYIAMREAFRWKARHLKRVVLPSQPEFFDSCYEIADGQHVPTVTLHFAEGVDLLLPLDNTIIPVDDSGKTFCLAFVRSDGKGDLTIIGNVQQQGFRVEFDVGKGKVGFTQQDCSLP